MHKANGDIVAVDRLTSVAVDVAEPIAAKTALQNATAELAERLLPRLAKFPSDVNPLAVTSRASSFRGSCRAWVASVLMACTVPAATTFGAEGQPAYSLAVLGSSELRETGLADVSVTALSKVGGLLLVERERLDVVAREYEAGVFAANAKAADRVKLGRLLGADTLVLLSLTGERTNAWVRLVISDCQSGARLRVDRWPFEKARLNESVARIKAAVLDARKAFPQGVKQVVGVAPFISRNLTHDFDHLQRRYAYQLQQALAAVPGVAVMETEEAVAIQNELALAAPQGIERIVPVLVEGEYLVETRAGAPPQITLTVRIARPPAAPTEVRRGPMLLTDVPAFLVGELSRLILRPEVLKGAGPVSAAEQFVWLVGRADELAQLGFWWDATGLREAALLLKPDDVPQRLKLIGEYSRAMTSAMPEVAAAGDWKFDDVPINLAIGRRVDAHLVRAAHAEYLIRARAVPLPKALELAACGTPGSIAPFATRTFNGRYQRIGQEQLLIAETAKEQFILQVMPELLRWIDEQPGRKNGWLENWQRTVMAATLMRWDRTYRTKEELEFIQRVLTQVVPDLLPTAFDMTQFLSSGGRRYEIEHKGVATVTPADWVGFLDAVEKSGLRVCNLYARYAKVIEQSKPGRARSAEELRALSAQAEKLLADYAATPFREPGFQPRNQEWMFSGLRDTCGRLAREVKRLDGSAPSQPIVAAPPRPDHRDFGRIRFEELELKVRRKNGEIVSAKGIRHQVGNGWYYLQHVVPCGKDLDVWWQPGAILFMRNPGIIEEVFVDRQVQFDDVRWNGNTVWIATKHAGVWAVQPDGKILTKFTSDAGLPPADDGMLVQPLTNGSAIAVGSFGSLERAWCALLTPDGRGGGAVKVFHEARRVVQVDEARGDDMGMNPGLCFRPHWLHRYEAKDGRQKILVGRYTAQLAGRRRPLEIDPVTLEVRVFGGALYDADHRWSDSYFSRAGFIVEADTMGVGLRPPPGERLPDGSEFRAMCPDRPDWQTVGAQGGFTKQLFALDGWVYAPGGTWWRIDPQTWKSERLVPWRVPQRYESLRNFGASAHYGLVAWDERTHFRVTIAPAGEAH